LITNASGVETECMCGGSGNECRARRLRAGMRGGIVKSFIIGAMCVLSALVIRVCAAEAMEFRVADTWRHDMEITGRIGGSTILKNGHVAATFYGQGPVEISSRASELVCRRGQGPDELQDLFAACEHPLGLAFVELPFRIKIFGRDNGDYRCRQTIWLEKSRFYTAVSSALFCRGKWFLAGYFLENFSRKYVYKKVFVKVYDAEGKYIKGLIRRTDHEPDQRHLMDYHLVNGGDRIFFLEEDRLRVTVIQPESLEIEKVVDLEAPEEYRPMPKDFYVFKRYDDPYAGIGRDMDNWRTGYSRIMCAAFDRGTLVLQIRVFEKAARFMVLFFREGSFQPAGRVLTNDRLLGVREGRFYFYAGGDPRYEDEADRCRIKVCTLEN